MKYFIINSPSIQYTLEYAIQKSGIKDYEFIIFPDRYLQVWPVDILNKKWLEQRSEWIFENLTLPNQKALELLALRFWDENVDPQDDEYETENPMTIFQEYQNFHKKLEKIVWNDEIFIYVNHNSEWLLAVSYILHFLTCENIFIYTLRKLGHRLSLGEFSGKDMKKYIFGNHIRLTEKLKIFYKNLITQIPKNNLIRDFVWEKMKYYSPQFLDSHFIPQIPTEKTSFIGTCGKVFSLVSDKLRTFLVDSIIYWRFIEAEKQWFVKIFKSEWIEKIDKNQQKHTFHIYEIQKIEEK